MLGSDVLQELPLGQGRITLGRGPENDLVLAYPMVSTRHAAIQPYRDSYLLEDLDSTNGTKVNGRRISKQALRDGDMLEIAAFHLFFREGGTVAQAGSALGTASRHPVENAAHSTLANVSHHTPTLDVLDGPHAGKQLAITRILTTFGLPDKQVAVIYSLGRQCYLMHVEGESCPQVNDTPVGAYPYLLDHLDVIHLAGTHLRFGIR